MKKITKKIIAITLGIVFLGAGLFWWSVVSELGKDKPCAFCNQTVLQTHTFYEDNLVRGLCSYEPIETGHCLAVVKRHIERFEELTDEEILALGQLIKKINTAIQKINGQSSYLILQKNGPEVGQTVPHVHVHYIPKKTSSNKVAVFGLLWGFIMSPFIRPLTQEKLAEWVGKMKQALAAQPEQTTAVK